MTMTMTTNAHEDIYGSVMLVELRVSQWTARKMDKRVVADVARQNNMTEEAAGAYYKSLVSPHVIRRISSCVNAARSEYYRKTLPWRDDGPRILPSELYFDFMEAMGAHKARFEELVEEFLRDYPYHREEAKRALGDLFNADEYPKPEELAERYAFRLSVMPLPRGSDFRCRIGEEESERIRAQIEEENKATLAHAMRDAFNRVLEVANRYVDRLSDTDNVFRDSMVESARELVEIMPALNVTKDPELDKVINIMRERIAPHDPDTLRKDMTTRKEVAEAARGVVSTIEQVFGVGVA